MIIQNVGQTPQKLTSGHYNT